MFKRLFLFLLSIIIPPIGIFFIIKSKGEGKNIIPAKICLICILIFISSIFWMITYPKIHDAYDSYSKPNVQQVIDSASPIKEEIPTPVVNIFSADVTPSAVRNDVTGNWKKVLISEDIAIQEKALEYYNTYFDSEKEIHAVINFANNTTTKISVLGDSLDVTIYEYVSKEEHDAKILFSGQLLAEYFVNMDTGEIEQIQ